MKKLILSTIWIVLVLCSCEKETSSGGPIVKTTSDGTIKDLQFISGSYKTEVKLTANEFIRLTIDVSKTGPFIISSDTVNGYFFSASGKFTITGETKIELYASGTPLKGGEDNFEVSFGKSKFSFKNTVSTSLPAGLANKMIITATFDSWYDIANLYAYRAIDGTQIWSRQMKGYVSQACVNADTLFVNSDYKLEAYDINTGNIIWAVTSDTLADIEGVTYSQGVLYCNHSGGGVYAFNSRKGSLLWNYKFNGGGVVTSLPTVVNNVVYVGFSSLYAINTNGTLKWKYDLSGFSRSSPALDDGKVYLSTDDGFLYAFNANEGSLIWKYNIGTDGEESPTVANGRIYSGNQHLYCLNSTNGNIIWKKENLSLKWLSPDVFNNVVYVSGKDSIQALNAETGKLVWGSQNSYVIVTETVPCDDIVVYGSGVGLNVRFRENGEKIWSNGSIYNPMNIVMQPIIYDKSAKAVFYPTLSGNKQ